MWCQTAKNFGLWLKGLFIAQAAIGSIPDYLKESKDVITAVNLFVVNFQMEHKAKIESYSVKENVVNENDHAYSGVTSLEFKYKIRRKKDLKSGKAILKIPSLANLPSEELIASEKLFKREVYFYQIILPELYRLGQCAPFAPKLYAATSANALVLEDLRGDGFKPTDQKHWLNLNECRVSLEVLATYHALGYKYLRSSRKKDPQSLIKLSPSFGPDNDSVLQFYEAIQSSLNGELLDKVYELSKELINRHVKYPPENSMTVLIHGDFRTSNIFLKYNGDNQVSEAKIIDWQFSVEGNPVLDLIVFFINSVSIEMIENNDDVLLNFYLEKLNTKLASLGMNSSYNKDELMENMNHYKHFYYGTLCHIFLVTYNHPRGEETDYSIAMALKWLSYLNKKGII